MIPEGYYWRVLKREGDLPVSARKFTPADREYLPEGLEHFSMERKFWSVVGQASRFGITGFRQRT